MINSVKVTSYTGENITIYPGKPWMSGFESGAFDGIGPESATINTTDLSTSDGGVYNSSRIGTRNITWKLYPMDYGYRTVEKSRIELYKYFPLKRAVNLKFYTTEREAEINGYVEKVEPDIFQELEAIDVSIICPDPYFYDISNKSVYGQDYRVVNGITTTVFSGIVPEFEFPFENNSTSEKLLEMGNIVNDPRKNIYYEGDVAIGFTINVHFLGTVTGFKFYDVESHEVIAIDDDKFKAITGGGFKAGDDVIISTVRGNKYVYLMREGVYTNILNAIDRDVTWLELNRGDNLFVFTTDKGFDYVQISVINRTAYLGI